MADAVALALGLVFICGIVFVAITVRNALLRADLPWKEDESPDGQGNILVRCVKHGESPVQIGPPIPVNQPDFENVIEERRIEADLKLAALNSRLRLGGR